MPDELNEIQPSVVMPIITQAKIAHRANFERMRKDIAVICDYLEGEQKHYEESGRPRNHIWRYVKRVKQWLEKRIPTQ